MAYDDEHDTLAAEYVLGTLSAEEREQAEALLSLDAGFEASVRQWERRLGELNVMVEAVEPRPEVWEKIKTSIAPAQAGGEAEMPRAEMPRAEGLATDQPSPLAVLDSKLSERRPKYARRRKCEFRQGRCEHRPRKAGHWSWTRLPICRARLHASLRASCRSIGFAPKRRAQRRCHLSGAPRAALAAPDVAVGAIAALLALYVAVWQAAPELIPRSCGRRLRHAGAA